MEFKILNSSSKKLDKLPAIVRRIKVALDKLPTGEMIRGMRGLAEELDCNQTTVAREATHPALDGYRATLPRSNAVLWANKETIKAYKKEFAE